ncbi:MAG TPA: prepilin-type N-terminal cleavage/methylation domain-containing protein [Gallionella sp.]|nr:prepilin-type N-terminal cleavage/methylation domain-containing protein [Gallionella sp.]
MTQVVPSKAYPLPSPDGATSHSAKPASGQVAGYLPQAGEGLGERGACVPQASLSAYRTSAGFTLIELIVVVIIVAILTGLFLKRISFYQEQAEKAAMESVAAVIQSALVIQVGHVLARGKSADLVALANDNPMNWLQKRPPNYAGEFNGPTPLSVKSGNWVFDLKSRDLIYVVHNGNHFTPGKDGNKWVRFHVVLNYEPSRLPSQRDAPPELTGTQFAPVEPYAWF